jgi:hypothetical protein
MMIDELERRDDLPWGFHDAMLRAMHVDWLKGSLTIELRVKVSERQDLDRGGRITVTGLEWLVVDPPSNPLADYDPALVGGYDIDSRPGAAREGVPETSSGTFVHHFFVVERNSFIHLCARDASFEWTDAAPAPCGGTALFPGDDIPDASRDSDA